MTDGGRTPNIAALPAIARLGTCESARGPDADRHVKLLSQFAVEGSLSGAYSQHGARAVALHLHVRSMVTNLFVRLGAPPKKGMPSHV